MFEVLKNNGEISIEVSHFANGRETDADKRIFHMKFGFKDRRYDKDKRYYLVVFGESTGKESFKHNVIIDLAFADEF
jgi:hypothetical protein